MISVATVLFVLSVQDPVQQDPPAQDPPAQSPAGQTPPAPVPEAQGDAKPLDPNAPAREPLAPDSTAKEPALPGPVAPPAAKPAAEDDEWKELDRVLVIVNEDVLTRGSMFRTFQRAAAEHNVRTAEDRERVWNEIGTTQIRAQIKKQAGEAMGFDPARIEQFARDDFDRTQKRWGGVVGLSERLERDGLTAEQLKQIKRDSIYTELWEDAITGRGVSVAARPSRDRYVRPGLLRFEYQNSLMDPQQLVAIGGREDELTLQHLLVDVKGYESPDRARAVASELRSRIVDGEDMPTLVQQYSANKAEDGKLVPAAVSSACRVFPPARSFLVQAKAGEVSDVFAFERQGSQGFVVLRVLERKPGYAPDLASTETQKKLTSTWQQAIDDFRIETALRKALAGSYTWQAGATNAR